MIKTSSLKSAALGAGLALLAAGVANAHAHLVTAAPAANSTGASPSQIRLTFSETLESKFSGFEVDMADGMKINVAVSADPADAKTLVGILKTSLPSGAYRVQWHAVSSDTHRMTGSFSFTVR